MRTCTNCGAETYVIDTRLDESANEVMRIRCCKACEMRYKTKETLVKTYKIKNGKVAHGLYKG